MGAYLSEPVKAKQTESFEGNFYNVGISSMQGWRANMED